MKTFLFFAMALTIGSYLFYVWRRPPSRRYGAIDAIVPAYNEEPCLEQTLLPLLQNKYVHRVICVNDGSTDGTAQVLARMSEQWGDKLLAINQTNTGKGGALMNGLSHVTTETVFLTDADTFVPNDDGLGYMLAEVERGADAVGGIPSSNLSNAGLLPHIRATVKMPMIMLKRTFQQLVGGAPFIISGACGLFKVEVLRKYGFSDRTKVEDLDLTWTLVAAGYKIRQANRCVVYPQECTSAREEWKRWRRWIVGYAVCMRLHKGLLFSRFGLVSIFPMFALVVFGVVTYAISWTQVTVNHGPHLIAGVLFPLLWVAVVTMIGAISALHHRKFVLMPLASLAVSYVLLSYAIWLIHGLKGLITGREPKRDKPTRYSNVVGTSPMVESSSSAG